MKNREIKFRARIMGKWYYFTLDQLRRHDLAVPHVVYEVSTSMILINQWTGLHDKNGVDIYEGDIIEYKSGGREVVEFIDGAFMVGNGSAYLLGQLQICNGILIGNIYEDPELLSITDNT